MSDNMEIERKYLLRMPDAAALAGMSGCVTWQIEQSYLGDEGDVTRRVRSIVCGEHKTYVYTEKRRVNALSCEEREREIDVDEYERLLKQRDPTCHTIHKTRMRIPWRGQLLEVDIYSFWQDRATLEIELKSENQTVELPDWLKIVREVTGEGAYKNRALAREVPMEALCGG